VQDQPVVGVAAEGLRHDPLELGLDLIDILAGGKAGAVADPEDMGVDREGLLAECGVEDDIGGLAADPGKFLEQLPGARHLAAEAFDQRLREGDHVFGLGIEQTDRFDRVSERFFPESDHLRRCFDAFEQVARRNVHAGVGRLRGEHHRDQQLIDVARIELGRRRRVGLGQPSEEFENLGLGHRAPMTSRIE